MDDRELRLNCANVAGGNPVEADRLYRWIVGGGLTPLTERPRSLMAEACEALADEAEPPTSASCPLPWLVCSVWGSPQTGLQMRVDQVEAISQEHAIGVAYGVSFQGHPLVMVSAVELERGSALKQAA